MDAPSIYPVASLHLTPTRFVADPAISRNPRPGCRHRQPPCRPGRSRCGPRSQTGDRRLPAMPSQPRWSPPDPQRPWPCPAGTLPTTTPTVGSGLAPATPAQGCRCGCHVGGGPVFPSRRRHGLGGSQQLPQQRYLLVRRRTVLAGPTTGQCPFAVPYGRSGQLRPGPGVRFPQFRNAGSGHWLTPRSVFLPKSDDILANPSD